MKKDKIVKIEWEDSCTDNGWHYPRTNYTSSKCRTVGMLLNKDKKVISVYQSISDSGNITEVMTIPRKNVLNIKFLREE